MMFADFLEREGPIVDGHLVHPTNERPARVFMMLGKRGQSSQEELAGSILILRIDAKRGRGFAVDVDLHTVFVQLTDQMVPLIRHIMTFRIQIITAVVAAGKPVEKPE
jgi:hypothetical protein